MKIYNLIYDLGLHHVPIVVPESSFYKVLDDLSNEFEIIKSHIPNLDESSNLIKVEVYNIINYWGVEQAVGFVSIW